MMEAFEMSENGRFADPAPRKAPRVPLGKLNANAQGRGCEWEEEKRHLMECLGKQMDECRRLKGENEELRRKATLVDRVEEECRIKVLEAEGEQRKYAKKVVSCKERIGALTVEVQSLKRANANLIGEVDRVQGEAEEARQVQGQLVRSLQQAHDEIARYRASGLRVPSPVPAPAVQDDAPLDLLRRDVQDGHANIMSQLNYLIANLVPQYSIPSDKGTAPGVTLAQSYSPSADSHPRSPTPTALTPKDLFNSQYTIDTPESDKGRSA